MTAIENEAHRILADRDVPGLSIAVAIDGELVYREAFGYADLEHRLAACPQTQFRAASVSKLFTSAAMARLFEQRRIDLDAPIQRYVPAFPTKSGTITPRLLAAHRAGIRAYRDDLEAINTKHYNSVTESLERFRDDPLVSPPGTSFTYSNYGYVLLSAALEGAAGENFLTLMRREVFEPLDMRSTQPDQIADSIPARSVTYDNETPFSPDGRRVRSPLNDFSSKWASGGFLSTAEDLTRFGSAFIDTRRAASPFLHSSTIAMLTRPQSGLPPVAGYGLGWMTASDLHLRRVHFHFGASSGGTAVLAVYPASGVVVALMANLGHAKFPFAALVNIAKPFLPWFSPDRKILAGVGVCLALLLFWKFMRERDTERKRAA